MPRITARDAQVFVGGAFAIQGLHALLQLPYLVAIGENPIFSIAGILGALALPLGIAILVRNILAVTVAYIYLWLDVLFGCAVVVVAVFTSELRIFQNTSVRDAGITAAGQVVLLGLLFWSRRKQQREP
jgi:hypothetical protein